MLDSWLRHYASDFLAESELFADSPVGGSAPTFADSLAVWYRVSPGETALSFYRKRLAYHENAQVLRRRARSEEPHAARLPTGRGRAADGAGGARRLLCSWQPSELMLRAWMKDATDAHARDCPNIKRIIKPVQPHQPLGGVGNNATRRCASACSSASLSWRTAAATCRTCTRLYAARRPQPVGRAAGSRASGRSCRPSGRSATPELDQLCNLKSNSAEMRALLRCEHDWEWPAFDDARLLSLNKKRREADVLRCVCRCQRGEYVFAPQRRDRPLLLARARAV